jgi:peptidoglycan/xylan/chitin deacetylase (PgdA/CDA1 family)
LIINTLRSIPILVYHKIDPKNEIGINTISPKRFEKQIQFLGDNGYQTLTFPEITSSGNKAQKRLIITFDDGYESVYEHAYPILKQAGYKAVVFPVTAYIGDWNYWDANLGGIRFRHLSAEQIRELSAAGWEVGSHSVHHRPLPYLNSSHLEWEVYHSRGVLQNVLNKVITTFSYPFGMQNLRVRRAAEKAGYKFACKNISLNGRTDDAFSISRIPVYKFDTIESFKKKLAIYSHPAEGMKLSLLNWPARFTTLYQILFRKQLFLEK